MDKILSKSELERLLGVRSGCYGRPLDNEYRVLASHEALRAERDELVKALRPFVRNEVYEGDVIAAQMLLSRYPEGAE